MRRFLRWVASFLGALACLHLSAGPAQAERRVALVVGNSAYKIGRLANPANDADAVAAALKELGFDRVMLRKDLGVEGFRTALSEMARASAGADVAAVFFAGHGIEREGRNYLIPIDAELERASDLDLQAIALATVLDQIGGATKLKLVILDACRNNVFPVSVRQVRGHDRHCRAGLHWAGGETLPGPSLHVEWRAFGATGRGARRRKGEVDPLAQVQRGGSLQAQPGAQAGPGRGATAAGVIHDVKERGARRRRLSGLPSDG